jgi:phosphoribosylanthranilate isomerase
MAIGVKICGVNTTAAVDSAVSGGASFVGLMFYPPSPRYVTSHDAAKLAALVPAGIHKVGVFVDPTDALLERVLAQVGIDMVQLHGKETPERVETVKARTGREVIKALAVASAADVAAARAYDGVADWLLFDAKPNTSSALPGGNGTPFDWGLLQGTRWQKPWLLSGGLTPENVAAAAKATGARFVDVSSGVEDAPGQKSPARIRAFLDAARKV